MRPLTTRTTPSPGWRWSRPAETMAIFGDGPQYPAVSRNVIAFGGTSLIETSSHYYDHELAWSDSYYFGAGSGCFAYEPYTPIADPAFIYSVSASRCDRHQCGGEPGYRSERLGADLRCLYGLGKSVKVDHCRHGSGLGNPDWCLAQGPDYNAVYKGLHVIHDPMRGGQAGVWWPSIWSLAGRGWDGPTGLELTGSGSTKGCRCDGRASLLKRAPTSARRGWDCRIEIPTGQPWDGRRHLVPNRDHRASHLRFAACLADRRTKRTQTPRPGWDHRAPFGVCISEVVRANLLRMADVHCRQRVAAPQGPRVPGESGTRVASLAVRPRGVCVGFTRL